MSVVGESETITWPDSWCVRRRQEWLKEHSTFVPCTQSFIVSCEIGRTSIHSEPSRQAVANKIPLDMVADEVWGHDGDDVS